MMGLATTFLPFFLFLSIIAANSTTSASEEVSAGSKSDFVNALAKALWSSTKCFNQRKNAFKNVDGQCRIVGLAELFDETKSGGCKFNVAIRDLGKSLDDLGKMAANGGGNLWDDQMDNGTKEGRAVKFELIKQMLGRIKPAELIVTDLGLLRKIAACKKPTTAINGMLPNGVQAVRSKIDDQNTQHRPILADENCTICYNEIGGTIKIGGKEYRQIPRAVLTSCKHVFHKSCLKTWLNMPPYVNHEWGIVVETEKRCPVCRAPLDIVL